jgi:uncharacterized integral membrane protein
MSSDGCLPDESHDLNTVSQAEPSDTGNSQLNKSIEELEYKSTRLNLMGILLIASAILLAIGLFVFIYCTTNTQLINIDNAVNPYATLIFLIVRSSALGGVAITVLLSLMRMANAVGSVRKAAPRCFLPGISLREIP